MRRQIASLVLFVVVAGCAAPGSSDDPAASGPEASQSTSAPASATSSAQESSSSEGPASPTPVPSIGFEPSGSWTLAESTVDGLRVRAAPAVDADPVALPVADAHVEWQLFAGDRVVRYAPAGFNDGYDWWEILGTPRDWTDVTFHGYVAGGPDTDPWLVDVADAGCPETPTLNELRALDPIMQVACYQQAPLTFTAYAWDVPGEGYGGACGVSMEGIRVDWLQCDYVTNWNFVNPSGNTDATFLLHYNPDVLAAPDMFAIQGQRFRITGHFADAASLRCPDVRSTPDEQTVAYWYCATKFVIDQLEPLQD